MMLSSMSSLSDLESVFPQVVTSSRAVDAHSR
jgi:hypothetical protein